MNFAEMFGREGNIKYTENGGKALSSTNGGALLDLFATIGGMRNRDAAEIDAKWCAARKENAELADNLILYTRDIRSGGLGERRLGRIMLHRLACLDPEKVIRNFDRIVEVGRWDDLLTLIDTSVRGAVIDYINEQLKADLKGMVNNQPISICAKWMPSINTSSRETRELANEIRTALGLKAKAYRKMLSKLRAYLNVLEVKMSNGQWDEINFESVPSVAMNRYMKSFNTHCQESFQAYKNSLIKGEKKINATTLYPYDIVEKILYDYRNADMTILEEQWKALPNYVEGNHNVICICDVSGSMTGRPMATSVGLGIYFAQRNTGAYHNMYMTFTSDASICKIQDHWSLKECIGQVKNAPWGWSTNLDRAYQRIFDIAQVCGDAPAALAVISDMEIDTWDCSENQAYSITEKWARKYAAIGLKAPKLIYWNVNARQDTYHATASDNVAFVSGSSAGVFKNMTELITNSAYDSMVKILSKPAFSWN